MATKRSSESVGHHHPRGGGWVGGTAHVDSACYVGPNVRILGKVVVKGAVKISGSTTVTGNAHIAGNVKIKNSHIYGNCTIFDNVYIESSVISGYAHLADNAKIAYSEIGDVATVKDNAKVLSSVIRGRTCVRDYAKVGHSKIGDGYFSNQAVVTKNNYQVVCGLAEWGRATFFMCSDKKRRVVIGCRYFTAKEALKHWGNCPRSDRKKTISLIELAIREGWL